MAKAQAIASDVYGNIGDIQKGTQEEQSKLDSLIYGTSKAIKGIGDRSTAWDEYEAGASMVDPNYKKKGWFDRLFKSPDEEHRIYDKSSGIGDEYEGFSSAQLRTLGKYSDMEQFMPDSWKRGIMKIDPSVNERMTEMNKAMGETVRLKTEALGGGRFDETNEPIYEEEGGFWGDRDMPADTSPALQQPKKPAYRDSSMPELMDSLPDEVVPGMPSDPAVNLPNNYMDPTMMIDSRQDAMSTGTSPVAAAYMDPTMMKDSTIAPPRPAVPEGIAYWSEDYMDPTMMPDAGINQAGEPPLLDNLGLPLYSELDDMVNAPLAPDQIPNQRLVQRDLGGFRFTQIDDSESQLGGVTDKEREILNEFGIDAVRDYRNGIFDPEAYRMGFRRKGMRNTISNSGRMFDQYNR